MSAGVEGVRGARQECDVDLVITYEFRDIPHWTTKGSIDTIRVRKRKRTRTPGCFFFLLIILNRQLVVKTFLMDHSLS